MSSSCPVPLATLAPDRRTAEADAHRDMPGGATRRFRVLVVDDLPAIHSDMQRVLNGPPPDELAGAEEMLFGEPKRTAAPAVAFDIDTALQGEEAVELVRHSIAEGRPYAVAFIDMRMPPGMDGLQTMLALWRIDPQIQVVSCSAYSDYSWNEMIASTGETDQLLMLRKPFDPIEVVQLAHALSRKWELQCAARRRLESLEALVAERTRELTERQALFELILQNATDLIAVVDADGNRVYNSPSYRTVLGFDPAELKQTHAFAQIHPEDMGVVTTAVAQARQSGHGDPIVYRMRHRDGSWRTLESCAGVVRDADGRLAYFVVVARDITARHELELKQQLGQKLESIGRLAAGIAHEINTPTQFITDNMRFLAEAFGSFTQVLAQYRACREQLAASADTAAKAEALAAVEQTADIGYLAVEVPKAIEQNLEGLARVARIVGSLKDFSHPGEAYKVPVDLNAAIENAVTLSRHEWKYVAEVITDFAPDLPPVPCLRDEINQVVLNLLVNAAHTIGDAVKDRHEARGTITVRTRAHASSVCIEIEDTGMGIPPEVQHRIFEPFFTTKAVGKGTGQGLAIVHAVVVKHHGGTVDFRTEVGRGTTFCIHLPLTPS